MSLKRAARRLLGPLYDPIQSVWSTARAQGHAARERRRERRILRLLTRDGIRILGGPFAGMTYVPTAAEGNILPKLAGTYEKELDAVIEEIVHGGYADVVDIGAADGYYAVGLAMRMPDATIHAWDIDARSRDICAQLARINGVESRVRIGEVFDPHTVAGRRVAVICDCEGCETEILQSGPFAEADILVELHEFIRHDILALLTGRFAASHDIQVIESRARDGSESPVLASLAPADRRYAVDERRPGVMRWLWMKSRRATPV